MLSDDRQLAWRQSWAGWDEIPVTEVSRSGYNALHDQIGGGSPLDVPRPEWWMNGVPHRFWDPAEVDKAADGWGARWDDQWAEQEGDDW